MSENLDIDTFIELHSYQLDPEKYVDLSFEPHRALPAELFKNLQIRHLILQEGSLTCIPDRIADFKQLVELDFNNNYLFGMCSLSHVRLSLCRNIFVFIAVDKP